MTSFHEGELRIAFGDDWHAEQFDRPGASFPRGVLPVDFIAEGDGEIVLVEIKDPSASRAPDRNREDFVRKMKSKELTHQELVPKARTSYGFLHLMMRDTKPMRYVVVIGTEKLSVQPALFGEPYLAAKRVDGTTAEAAKTAGVQLNSEPPPPFSGTRSTAVSNSLWRRAR